MNIHDITKQIRAFADQLDAEKAPTPLPIQTLAADQVTATPTMQDVASRVLEEEPEKSDPYAELKAAHAAGKVIQAIGSKGEWKDIHYSPLWNLSLSEYRIKPDDGPPWIEWHGGECPLGDEDVENFEYRIRNGKTSGTFTSPSLWRWTHEGNHSDIIAYRVLKARTPTPKQPLGPQDVPPGSVLLSSSAGVNGMQWTWVHCVKSRGVEINGRDCIAWAELKEHWKINRPRHRDENGNPTLWEACEK